MTREMTDQPAQSAPSAEELLELDKRLQVEVKSEGDEHTPARWDVVYFHPETKQFVRFRNDHDAATQRVQVRGMISMYAEAYAALRTEKLERELREIKALDHERCYDIACETKRAETVESSLAQLREEIQGLESEGDDILKAFNKVSEELAQARARTQKIRAAWMNGDIGCPESLDESFEKL